MERKKLVFFDEKEAERFKKEVLSDKSKNFDIRIEAIEYGLEKSEYRVSWIS